MKDDIALIFPGQGPQYEGMGRDIYNKFPTARNVYEIAEDSLGVKLLFNPRTSLFRNLADYYQKIRLKGTDYAQLVIFVTNHAFYEVLKEKMPSISYRATTGHSLGLYNAIVAAGAMSFSDTMKLVRKRGRYMHDVSKKANGGLVTVFLKDGEDLNALARSLEKKGVYVAVFNTHKQIVVGGPKNALDDVIDEFGQRNVRKLEIGCPSHTIYMQEAADMFKDDIDSFDFRLPSMPIVTNSSARFIVDPRDIQQELYEQLYKPVKWQQSVEILVQQGIQTLIVVGADKRNVIKRIIEQINPNVKVFGLKDAESLEVIANKI